MNHANIIIDTDKHFEIDPITRAIKDQSLSKISVIQYDHNSERFSFSLPRIIEGHDMTECNRVEVHYINNGKQGLYEVTDLAECEEDNTKVCCSWLLSQNATGEVGALSFLLRFACVAADGTVDYAWNTAIFKGISVAEGMCNSEAIVEQYADVLEQWKQQLENASDSGGSVSSVFTVTFRNSYWDGDIIYSIEVDKTPDEIIAAIRAEKNICGVCVWNGQDYLYANSYFIEDVEVVDPWTENRSVVTRIYFDFLNRNERIVWVYRIVELIDAWSYYVEKIATEDYVDTAIGDIETALDNIITKYGLGGDSV